MSEEIKPQGLREHKNSSEREDFDFQESESRFTVENTEALMEPTLEKSEPEDAVRETSLSLQVEKTESNTDLTAREEAATVLVDTTAQEQMKARLQNILTEGISLEPGESSSVSSVMDEILNLSQQ